MKLYRRFIRPMHGYPGQHYEPKTEPIEKEEKWYPEEERERLEKKYASYAEVSFSDLIFEEKYEPFLLKEQEPVEPKKGWFLNDFNIPQEHWFCGKCDEELVGNGKYCANCGQKVKWE